MSNKITPSPEDAVSQAYIVATPRTSDMISGALLAAFGRQDPRADEFTALLRRIDIADQDSHPC